MTSNNKNKLRITGNYLLNTVLEIARRVVFYIMYRVYIIILSSVIFLSVVSCSAGRNNVIQKESTIENSMKENATRAFKNTEYEKSAQIYKQLLDSDANNKEYMFMLAESLRMSGKPEQALIYYRKLPENNESDLVIKESIGLCYLLLGNFDEAMAIFSKIINEDASRWRTVNAMATSYALMGKIDESIEYYDMAVELNEDNPSVLNNIGLVLTLSGDVEQGLAVLDRALSNIDPADRGKVKQIEYNIALAYGLLDEEEKAEAILRKYLPEPSVFNNLGFYASLRDDKKLAKTYLSKALSSSSTYYQKAWQNLNRLE